MARSICWQFHSTRNASMSRSLICRIPTLLLGIAITSPSGVADAVISSQSKTAGEPSEDGDKKQNWFCVPQGFFRRYAPPVQAVVVARFALISYILIYLSFLFPITKRGLIPSSTAYSNAAIFGFAYYAGAERLRQDRYYKSRGNRRAVSAFIIPLEYSSGVKPFRLLVLVFSQL